MKHWLQKLEKTVGSGAEAGKSMNEDRTTGAKSSSRTGSATDAASGVELVVNWYNKQPIRAARLARKSDRESASKAAEGGLYYSS